MVLLEVWLRRWTGLLRIRSPRRPASADVVIEIADGGLIHPDAWSVLLRALQDSCFLPTPGPVAGAGHRRALAWLAWVRSQNPRRDLEERLQDAARLVLVAEQLAPDDPEVRSRARAIRQARSRGALRSAGQIRPQSR